MTELGDGMLVARAADSDLRAFDILVRRYQLPIFRFCLRMLGDRSEAEDAAQDTFFTAWRAIGRFRGQAKFSTWLYRLATNRCLKQLGRRPTAALDELSERPGNLGVPETEFEASQRIQTTAAAISRLTPEQRIVLILREVEELAYGEIATILGVSVTAVKSRLNRARVELARGLDETP